MIDLLSEIKSKRTVAQELKERGIALKNGMFCCPFHADKTPSAKLYEDGGWYCHGCKVGGDVVEMLARFDGKTSAQYLRDIGPQMRATLPEHVPVMPKRPDLAKESLDASEVNPGSKSRIVAIYPYHDANGVKVYEAVRYEPKTFRQRQNETNWSMDGVDRVPYRLPQLLKAGEVWIVEGEKDVATLEACGFIGTCNVGGAGKWLESYSQFLAGKDVVICGDNDEVGADHVKSVREKTENLARTVRVLKVPWGKDVSDFLEGMSDSEGRAALEQLRDAVEPLYRGEPLPLKSMAELERAYVSSFKIDYQTCLNMGAWLPSLSEAKIVPGEMVVIIAETGVGKSSILTNIALSHPHLNTVYFHLELSDKKVFERNIQTAMGISRYQIRSRYATDQRVTWEASKALDHILTCSESKLNLQKIESIVRRSEIRFGDKPRLVMIDYVQLMRSGTKQSRYEMFTDFAEGLKQMSKELNVVVVAASQVNRDKERSYGKLSINDAKDSGAIENSCSLMLGASRNPDLKSEMCVQVLKGTEIGAGMKITCHYNFETLRITEAPPKV